MKETNVYLTFVFKYCSIALSNNFDKGIPLSFEYVFSSFNSLVSTALEKGVLVFRSLLAKLITSMIVYNILVVLASPWTL